MVRRIGGAGRAFPVKASGYRYDFDHEGTSTRPMCGPPAVARLLTKGRSSMSHQSLSDDDSSISSNSRNIERDRLASNLGQDGSHREDTNDEEYKLATMEALKQKEVIVPQFDVEKATQYKGKRLLSPVSEGSQESSLMDFPETVAVNASLEPRQGRSEIVNRKGSDEHTLERTIVAMRHLIVQQQRNLKTLEEQNKRYRANLATCQDHILSLKKTQLDQQDELQKLEFERDSNKVEIMRLQDKLSMKKGKGFDPNVKHFSEMGRPEKVEKPGNASVSDIKRALQQRAFLKSSDSFPDKKIVIKEAPVNSKQNTPGKCSDIDELQRRAANLRMVVARMNRYEHGTEDDDESRNDSSSLMGHHWNEIRVGTGYARYRQEDESPRMSSQARSSTSGTTRVRFHSDVT